MASTVSRPVIHTLNNIPAIPTASNSSLQIHMGSSKAEIPEASKQGAMAGSKVTVS